MSINALRGSWLATGMLLLIASALPASAAAPDRIKIPSATPTALPQFLRGDARSVTVSGELYLPAGQGPFPAMVLKHESGGLRGPAGDNIRAWATMLNGWGVAALIVDGFGPRDIVDTDKDQAQLSIWADVSDSLAALKALGADPRIDKTRIGIAGWSRGGSAAIDTALDTVRKTAIGDDLRFALHVVFYGSGEAQYRDSATDRAPMLFLHGESDDYAPIGQSAK